MSSQQYNQFLAVVVMICAFGAMLNLAKLQSRGRSAQYLAGAFLALGLGVFLLRIGANQIFVGLAGAVTFGLLAADFLYRLGKPAKGRK
jgi:hypothetical protein